MIELKQLIIDTPPLHLLQMFLSSIYYVISNTASIYSDQKSVAYSGDCTRLCARVGVHA